MKSSRAGDGKSREILGEAALALEKGGADFLLICTNTMHKVVSQIEEKVNIPILHIADATAKEIAKRKIAKIGLLGTKYTMEQDFYKARIEANGIRVIIPEQNDREMINKIIFEELCLGKINPPSREYFKKVIDSLVQNGAEGIVLGCTEIGLLVKEEDSNVPLFDTTLIHALEGVNLALGDK